MSRFQVTLLPEELQRAKRKAGASGVSLGEYIRRLIARDLARPRSAVVRAAVMALGDSGGADVATAKDRYVGEAVASRIS
ncbi:MAG: CopG family transcriptional regulator [Candidatus Dormibacteria bacterium]